MIIQKVANILKSSRSVLTITGAGLSADSGMPTYRGVTGLYNRDTEDGISIEEALSGRTFQQDPALCWKYIRELELACSQASPNRGHEILAEWETRFERFVVLTQNIDGFHKRAGSKNLIEIHGDVRSLQCTNCSWIRENVDEMDQLKASLPPLCPRCKSVTRPPVVLFGEMLRNEDVRKYAKHIENAQKFDVCLSIGTTSVFPYIASPFLNSCVVGVEINPSETCISHQATYRIEMSAAEALGQLDEAMRM